MSRKPGRQDLGELDGWGLGGCRCTQGWRNAAEHPDVSWEHLAELDGSAEAWVDQEKYHVIIQQIFSGTSYVPGSVPGSEDAEGASPPRQGRRVVQSCRRA